MSQLSSVSSLKELDEAARARHEAVYPYQPHLLAGQGRKQEGTSFAVQPDIVMCLALPGDEEHPDYPGAGAAAAAADDKRALWLLRAATHTKHYVLLLVLLILPQVVIGIASLCARMATRAATTSRCRWRVQTRCSLWRFKTQTSKGRGVVSPVVHHAN